MANIFTIKVGSPNLLNSPLLDGELGFHLTNNTLYIGSSNGTVPIGGAGAFVPWENTDTDKTLTLGSLNLVSTPLAIESGGTGTTDLSTLTFVTSQITDLNEQGFLKNENLKEIGFSEDEEIWSLDIGSLKMGGAEVATQSWVEGKGYLTSVPEVSVDLSDYYNIKQADDAFVNVEGDETMKGTLLLSESPYLYFKNKNNSNSGEIYCGNSGQLGIIAKGNNGDKRELRINSQLSNNENSSALELIINTSFYQVYHTGWSGDLQLYARATSGSNYRSIQILSPNTSGVSDRNALQYQTYWGSPYTFTIYHSFNIVYSENEPTQDVFNGMIWLKPA